MIPPYITAKAVAFCASNDHRFLRGLTPRERQLFELEVDRLKGRNFLHEHKTRDQLRTSFWADQRGEVTS